MVLPLVKTFSEFEKILEKYELPFNKLVYLVIDGSVQ
jgi:hypothetical protein